MENLEIITVQGKFESMEEASAAGVDVARLYGPMRGFSGKMDRYEDKEMNELLST